MAEEFWHQNYALLDLLLSTNMSIADIAKEQGVSQSEIRKRIKELGLTWIQRKNRKMSRGQDALTQIIKKLIPNEEVVNEYHIGEQLRLDVYVPKYKLGAEYHGRQHFEHVTRFHETIDDFERAQKRDERKVELCKEQGISLVVFRYNDQLTEDYVFDRILSALNADGHVITKRPKNKIKLQTKNTLSKKDNPYYDQMKERRKEQAKEMRRKIKEQRKKKPDPYDDESGNI